MRKVGLGVTLALTLVVPALSAWAADAPVTYKACGGNPSKADEDAAKGLFQAGKTAYNEADYPRAIQYWRDAFERDCTAVLLLQNLANAYEKSGNIDAAILSLETYLKRKPDDAEAPTIQKRIENMRRLKKDTAPPPATTTASAAPPPTTAPTTPPPPPETKGPGIWPWVVVGGGAVFTIVGAVQYFGGQSKITDAEDACAGRSACPASVAEDGNSGRSQKQLGGILTGVGVVTMGAGVAWYFLAQPKQSTALVPNVAPGYGGLSAVGRF